MKDRSLKKEEFFIVDAHVHWGTLKHNPYMSATINEVLDLNRKLGVKLNLLAGRLEQSLPGPVSERTLLRGNEEMFSIVQKNKDCRMFAVYSPLYPSSRKQVEELAREGSLIGLKLGPNYHYYVIDSPIGDSVFEFLSTLGLPAVAHCMNNQFGTPEMFAKKAAKYPDVKINLYHMGSTLPENRHAQVIIQNKHNNLRVGCDHPMIMSYYGLLEDCVKKITSKKIIYGSDVPCQHPAPCIERIKQAALTHSQKADILGRNAIDFFRL